MKAKVKKVKIPLTGKDEGISEMFNQMLGAGATNMTISYPKYLRIRNLCQCIIKVISALAEFSYMRTNPEFAGIREEMLKFCEDSTAEITTIFSMDLSEYEWNLETVDDQVKKKFGEVYEAAKKSKLVNIFILTCDRLIPYKQNFNDLEKLNPNFIVCMSLPEWRPFAFSNLNFKQLFIQTSLQDNGKRFFMTVLYKIFTLTHQLWQETVSPDIDVDQFVNVIMDNMEEIKKRAPELSRCGKAFKKIADSVQLLKSNFTSYYRDFIETKDSTVMMQNFIIDVSKQTGSDPEVMREFREIIKYYKKIAKQQPNNPKMKALFDKVSESFSQLEKGATNLVNIKTEQAQEPEDDSEPIEVGPQTITEDHLANSNIETNNPDTKGTKSANKNVSK